MKNEFIIFNKFDSIKFDGRNYVIQNLIDDLKNNLHLPLNILLLRNQSLSFFLKNNKNFLNSSDIVFVEFKNYIKLFIKSKCFKDMLNLDKKYKNIIKLLKDDIIIDKFLSSKFLKAIPICRYGYTNKDILISCISGFPFIVNNFAKPGSIDEYNKIKE